MKNKKSFFTVCMLLFWGIAFAENNNSTISPQAMIAKMNSWTAGINSPMLIKSSFSAGPMKGDADIYYLGEASNVTWVMSMRIKEPTAYDYIVFKNKNSPVEAYFASLNQRVYRYDNSRTPSNLEKFMMKEITDFINYDDVVSFSQSMEVEVYDNGNCLLKIKVKSNDAMNLMGTSDLTLNVVTNSSGQTLESSIVASGNTIVNIFAYPNTTIVPQNIISEYVAPAFAAPLLANKAFYEADNQAKTIADQE